MSSSAEALSRYVQWPAAVLRCNRFSENYFSLYLMSTYGDPVRRKQLESGFASAGKKLDMGKACVRFRSLDDLTLDTVADIIAGTPVDAYVAADEESRKGRARRS